eukprot:gene3579-4459_t
MNKIQSQLIEYDFYSLYPKPESQPKHYESAIFRLSGNLKLQSAYDIFAGQKEIPYNCSSIQLSTGTPNFNYSVEAVSDFIYYVNNNFRAHFYIDDLPIRDYLDENKLGFQVGSHMYAVFENNTTSNGTLVKVPILNNHLDIYIETYQSSNDTFYIVGASVSPQSIAYSGDARMNQTVRNNECLNPTPLYLLKGTSLENVLWTYSVFITTSNRTWYERWNPLFTPITKIEAISVVYSVVIVLLLVAMVVFILLRIFKRNSFVLLGPEDSGWKAIYAEVFRSPNNFMTFSIIVGAGIQILVSSFIIVAFKVAGLLSIANQGGLQLAIILVSAASGLFNGYASMRTYIMLGGTRKKYNSVMTAFLIPFIILVLLFISDIPLWSKKFVYAPSAGYVFFVLGLWLFVSVPLSFLSSYFVRTWPPPGYPCHTNQIPRMIPPTRWYMNPILHSLILGVLPFVVIFEPLIIWVSTTLGNESFDYTYGLCFSFILFILSVISSNIIVEYIQLSNENYNWWWRSLLGPASTGIYVFIFLISATTNLISGTGFYYFMLCLIISILIAFFCSSIGFLGNLWFTKKIYSTLHFD